MDEQPEREPEGSADAEARRRQAVLAQLHRRRTKRRWTVGISALAATAVIVSGSVVAWSSQARAGDLAGEIRAWHEEHERASCELAVRIVSAVGLERRAADVLDAAEHVAGAEGLLPSDGRGAFAQQRDAVLGTIADGGFVTDEDRELADTWEARAAASSDPESYDVLGECIAAAAEDREPIDGVTAERADALARELRALGDPRDFDDVRIDRLEAAIAQLLPPAVATAEGRTALSELEALLPLAPEESIASLRSADAHIAAMLAVLRGDHSLADVLDLVEGLSLHIAAAWMAEAWQLEAQGDEEAAAELARASQATRDAIVNAAPRPVTDRGPARPAPVVPPREEAPVPLPPAPVETTQPRPSTPGSPAPTAPTSPQQPPATPGPVVPPGTQQPTDPSGPPAEPDPTVPVDPSPPPAEQPPGGATDPGAGDTAGQPVPGGEGSPAGPQSPTEQGGDAAS